MDGWMAMYTHRERWFSRPLLRAGLFPCWLPYQPHPLLAQGPLLLGLRGLILLVVLGSGDVVSVHAQGDEGYG